MSERWQQHMAMLQRFFDQQPKSTPTIYPRVPPPAQSAELPADMFSGEMAENMGFGAAPQGGTSPVVGYAAPSVMALAQTADINPGLARAGLAGLGMAHPAVGLGLGLGNTAANAVNTSANLDMLNGLGVSPSGWQGLGGLIGTNPLAGTYTGALNWAMADQLPGFAGMSVEQVPGDVTGSKFEAEIADIAAAMGPTADSAPRGDVVAEPLADLPGFASGGYTGAGADGVVQPWRPAGVVHEGEMVIPAWAVAAGVTPQGWQQLMQAPVGTSRLYPDTLTNPDPSVSPVVPPALRDPMAVAGARMRGQGGPLTADMLAAGQAASNEVVDQALGWAGQVINKVPPGIRAFHGSPHTFDRFDMRKIGTGEGAQAYGHGLYFAGNEGVARGYRDALNQRSGFRGLGFDVELGGKPLNEKGLPSDWVSAILDIKDAGDIERAWRQVPMLYKEKKVPEIRAIIDQIREQGVVFKPSGSMYEVSLRTSPERLLDWDKPLSAQPEAVLNAIGVKNPAKWKAPKQSGAFGGMNLRHDMTGADIARQPDAAHVLRNAGIDGIQYLDQGSRAAGEGTHNYVLFRDDIIDILRRYGLIGLLGGGAATAVPEQ